ncbi:type II secretion system F family protein [Rhodopirellula sp. JC740]|uniref:Type II secretion system F family protein n=1 Tax=Rhodopirellula halodulae TaxID=2894198 RepID=A0ABS8NLY3_9BACT|nr:type II secretion system F family protein [Rhodopirellula sp. JC740]MCC9643927.1 type II secretion system F family protein [Rhodopirellula sp. JC740]
MNQRPIQHDSDLDAAVPSSHQIPDGLLALSSVPHRSLVRVLSVAHVKRESAATWVELLAAEFKGPVAARMNHLATLLNTGIPVPDALEQTPRILPPSALMAIRLASETGTLSQTYDALLSDAGLEPETSDSGWRSPRSEFFRVMLGFLIAWMILSFLLIFIMPTFERMFEEFGLELPAVTRSLIAVSNRAGEVLILGIAIFGMVIVGRLLFSREPQPYRFNPMRWHERFVPPSVNLLSLLAIVVDSGRPITAGLQTLSKCHHIPRVRRQLATSCTLIEQGADPWITLANEQILTSRESRALSVAGSSAVQAWLLRWLAEARFNRRTLRQHFFTRLISVASLLLLAIVVAWSAFAVFLVLINLVRGLA